MLLSNFLITSLIFASLPISSAQAALRSDYQASVISFEPPALIAPGQTTTATITLKNVGKATWNRDGAEYVSLYHYDAARKIESSSSMSNGWETADRIARVPTRILSQGVATFRIPLKAPAAAGTYRAEFVLVAENLVRMSGSRFGFDLRVSENSATQPIATPTQAPASVSGPIIQPSGDGKWKAELVTLGGSEWQLEAEKSAFVTATFKNLGTQVWKREGVSYISLYASEGTKERVSPFRSSRWSGNQAGKLQEAEVKPGSTGTFKFEIRAPSTAGRFSETFTLAAEDTAWVQNGAFQLPISVQLSAEQIAERAAANTGNVNTLTSSQLAKNAGYGATLLLRSATEVRVSGNGSMEIQLGYKNSGTAAWSSRSLKLAGVQGATVGLASFRDPSWVDAVISAQVNTPIKPGEIGFITFKLKGPAKKGTYTASFQLYVDGFPIEGGYIDIPVTVTADGYIEPEPTPKPTSTPTTSPPNSTQIPSPSGTFSLNPQPLSGSEANLASEPMMRVGLYKTTDNRMVVRAKYAPVSVQLNGRAVCRLGTGEQASVQYDLGAGLYTLSGGPCSGSSSGVYKFLAEDGSSPMEIADYSRPISWLPGANDNTFRRQLELMWIPAKDSVWVVNELPIEAYLKGIAETSNVSPQQYQRTLLVAARTYAVYHVSRNTKHGGYFHVDAHLDQVYRGYGAEARGSNISAAVDSTRGQIVTYNGKLAITPYFSRSDGRTRAWGEVWYGGSNYPWLVSVPVPDDVGKTLWGHGVGMSATGALQMDAKHGKNYQEILAHFYRGTELRKAYR